MIKKLCSASRLTALSLLLAAGAACAQTEQLKMSLEMRFDPAHIDTEGHGRERLGLVMTSLLLEPAYDWWVGPAVVGAATGQRGGFFVLGGQVVRRWRSTDNWVAQLGLLMGGGGGGGAPVGGGLMLLPSASLSYDWGGVQTGLSVSSVNMPSGRISSRQIGLVVSWDGRFRYFDAGEVGNKLSTAEHTGLGFDRLMLDSAQLHVKAHNGLPASTVRLVGARAERRWGPNVYWGVETAAATHGGADGYMEILGTGGWETSASAIGLSDLYLGARVALGLGGGGAVETGGGTLGKAAGVLRWELGRDAFVGVEAGAVRSGSGAYNARYAQWQVGLQLDHPGAPQDAPVVGLAWSGSVQHVLKAARKDGRQLDLDTVGIKLKRLLGPNVYLTGQAHSAVAGQAGAYSVGLAGAGVQTGLSDQGWRLSAELLAGAAGGGGVDNQGGAVAQGMAYLGLSLNPGSEWQLGAGRIRGQHAGLNSRVLDLSWTRSFGVGQR